MSAIRREQPGQLLFDFSADLRELRDRVARNTRNEVVDIRNGWAGVNHKWWVLTLFCVLLLLVACYFIYTQLGWYADQRTLPKGSDWLLKRLPACNVLPILSWGWFILHLFAAGAAMVYQPRRIPFLLFMFSIYLLVRTAFVFLSPIGPPVQMVDMRKFDYIFSQILGTYTFTNEFIFSGHTSIPFLFFLFFREKCLKRIMLAGSLVMAVCVLLSHNHYSVDVLSAYLISYSIYAFSEQAYQRYVRPLFLENMGVRLSPVIASKV